MIPTTTTLTGLALAKNVSYLATFVLTVQYLGFNPQSLSLFIILMFIDVITGIARSYKIDGGEAVRSSIGIRGIVSKLLLLFALFSVAITSEIIGFSPDTYVQGAVAVLALGELYSILGNIHSYRTGKDKAEFDAVTYLLRRVRDVLDKVLK